MRPLHCCDSRVFLYIGPQVTKFSSRHHRMFHNLVTETALKCREIFFLIFASTARKLPAIDFKFKTKHARFKNSSLSETRGIGVYSNTDLVYSNTDLVYSNTDLLYSNTDLLYSNTDLVYSNTVLVYSNTDLVYSNTDLVYSNADRVYSNTDLVYSNTDLVRLYQYFI
jgi:hypothetical protein